MLYTLAIYIWSNSLAISTVFTNNRTQAVRLPAELRLPDNVKKVEVRARGKDRIISPVGHRWDDFFLNGHRVSDDFMNERGSQTQSQREEL
jgi:antitoxin VapB